MPIHQSKDNWVLEEEMYRLLADVFSDTNMLELNQEQAETAKQGPRAYRKGQVLSRKQAINKLMNR